MRLTNPFTNLAYGGFFESLLPDFVLGFAFFTALSYAVLGRRFDHQRPAVAMSAAVGLALSIGLVWWEHDRGLSVRDLGPVAIGFAVILLGMVMFQAIRQTGGAWSGAGIALGASLLVASILGFPWPIGSGIVPALAVLALIVGIVGLATHPRPGRWQAETVPAPRRPETAGIRHDMSDLYEDRRVGDRLRRGLGHLREESEHLNEHPQEAGDAMALLRKMLPAEGWLTERLARLREKSHYVRKGHLARIDELREAMGKLSAEDKKAASRELGDRYRELHLDKRLERLDSAVAENERRVRELTREAEEALARSDYRKLTDLLQAAEKLQGHNEKLLRAIDRTERKLATLAEHVAKEAPGVSDA